MQKSITIKGEVIKGLGLGRKIGFPTLNLAYDGELLGVFVARVLIDGQWKKAAAHIGSRPTIGDENLSCEVHVIDWEGKVEMGSVLEVEVLKKIRGVEKFKDIDELLGQIVKDVDYARKF